jgi:hypothetical protein
MLVKLFSMEEYYMTKLEESLVVTLNKSVLQCPQGCCVYSMEEYHMIELLESPIVTLTICYHVE